MAQVFSCEFLESFKNTFPLDTGPKLNVHKTFRRRPGRLLNVLCTFNLRPVSSVFFAEQLQATAFLLRLLLPQQYCIFSYSLSVPG